MRTMKISLFQVSIFWIFFVVNPYQLSRGCEAFSVRVSWQIPSQLNGNNRYDSFQPSYFSLHENKLPHLNYKGKTQLEQVSIPFIANTNNSDDFGNGNGNRNDRNGGEGGGGGGGGDSGNGDGEGDMTPSNDDGNRFEALSILFRKHKESSHPSLMKCLTSSYGLKNLAASISKVCTSGNHGTLSLSKRIRQKKILDVQPFLTWYVKKLETSPLITKSISGGVIGVIGDNLAQNLQYQYEKRKRSQIEASEKKSKKSSINQTKPFHYDKRRGLSVFFYDVFISSPLMHVGYDFFEKIIPVVPRVPTTASTKGLVNGHFHKFPFSSFQIQSIKILPSRTTLAAISHMLADCTFLDSIFIATSMTTTGLLEGYSFQKDIIPQLKSDYISNWKASMITSMSLSPLEFVFFRYLPVSFRSLAMASTDIIWDAVNSYMNHRNRSHEIETIK